MKKKRMSNKTFRRITIPVMAVVLAALIVGNVAAYSYRGLISTHFNHDTFKIVETGEDVDSNYFPCDFSSEEELNEHNGQVAQNIESEGLVLLENNGGLPLNKGDKVSVFSVSSVNIVYGGAGSGSVDTSTAPTLKTALEKSGLSVNPTLWDFYTKKSEDGYQRSAPNWRGGKFSINEVPWADVASAAQSSFDEYSDAAIVVISRSGGEGSDLTAVNFAETAGVADNSGNYLELSTEEADMLKAVNDQFDDVVVVLNANNAMELGWLSQYPNIKAAIWAGGVGQTGLYAIADALVGDVVPSGRLVDTYAADANSSPAAQNAGTNFWIENGFSNESDQYIVYEEGIYVGYRYYETRYEDVVLGQGNAGDYYFAVGHDAHDALNNILAAKGKTVADGMTAEGDSTMTAEWNNAALDTKTYAVDSTTGTEISNKFDYANIANYDEYSDTKYLTRNDWVGTFPTAFCTRVDETTGEKYITFPQEIIDALYPQYTEDKDAYTMPVTGEENTENLTLAHYRDTMFDDDSWNDILNVISADDLAYMVRMGGYGTPSLNYILKPATKEKDGPAGISATLIGGTQGMAYPTEVVIGSTWNTDLAYEMGVAVGNDAMFAGIQGWYAPAMNIHRTPYSGRNFEYYAEDGFISGKMGASTVEGAQSKGLFCYIKHFAVNDTEGVIDENMNIKGSKDGISAFLNEQALRELYLAPFEESVKSGETLGVMNAFNRIGTKWCGANYELLTDVLRNEWGFHGIVITDFAGLPDYMDIKAGLQAGTDMWMNTNETSFDLGDYKNDPQIMTYLRNAAHDICYTVSHSVAMNGLSETSKLVNITPLWMKWMYTLDAVVAVLAVGCIYWMVRRNKDEQMHPENYKPSKNINA